MIFIGLLEYENVTLAVASSDGEYKQVCHWRTGIPRTYRLFEPRYARGKKIVSERSDRGEARCLVPFLSKMTWKGERPPAWSSLVTSHIWSLGIMYKNSSWLTNENVCILALRDCMNATPMFSRPSYSSLICMPFAFCWIRLNSISAE